jgi:hypothetical protein
MPSALANRFIHLDLVPDFDSFKVWGLRIGLSEQILAFLAFRPTLLHQIDAQRPAWPSPRSWVMANQLRGADLSVEPAIGLGTAGEFEAFCTVYQGLPDLEAILEGKSKAKFPTEALGPVRHGARPHRSYKYGRKRRERPDLAGEAGRRRVGAVLRHGLVPKYAREGASSGIWPG